MIVNNLFNRNISKSHVYKKVVSLTESMKNCGNDKAEFIFQNSINDARSIIHNNRERIEREWGGLKEPAFNVTNSATFQAVRELLDIRCGLAFIELDSEEIDLFMREICFR